MTKPDSRAGLLELWGDSSLIPRLFVWGTLIGVVYFLRSFALLIFLTFVFAYIQSRIVERLKSRIKARWASVVLVATGFLGLLVTVGFLIIPQIRNEAETLATTYPQYFHRLDVELGVLSASYPVIGEIIPGLKDHSDPETGDWELRKSVSLNIFRYALGFEGLESGESGDGKVVDSLRNIGIRLFAVGSAFFLALLLSFLIVLDLPRLTESVRSLGESRLGGVYEEVAPGLTTFGRVLGRALEAQFFIAILNTIMTAIGLWLLGVTEKLAFLSMLVFISSFIPVAGVILSSIPICLVALQTSGFLLVLGVIVMIAIVHALEAYVFNPRIYGHHLKMNPVLVLIILTIGGKLFGIWGLVLGLPLCNYIFVYAIQRPVAENPETVTHLA